MPGTVCMKRRSILHNFNMHKINCHCLGLPTPVSVSTSQVSNTTATITWEYPPPPFQPIQSFFVSMQYKLYLSFIFSSEILLWLVWLTILFSTVKVTYSGDVEWRSPGGYLLQFEDSGDVSVTGTTATVSNLIPSTNYQFKVSAITANGRGGEMSSFALTRASQEGILSLYLIGKN